MESNFLKRYKLTYLQNRNRLTDIGNKFMITEGEMFGEGINQVFGINMLTILYMLEEEMATHSSILAWKILQTVEPGRLQSVR